MKTKLTVDCVLEMLKELKCLCDQNIFDNQKFSKTHPYFKLLLKSIESKGIFKLKTKKFTEIEPNEIMAKAILRIYLEEEKQLRQNKKIDSISKEEYEIDSKKLSYMDSLECKLKDYNKILDTLSVKNNEINNLKQKKEVLENANSSLIKQIGVLQQQVFFSNQKYTDSLGNVNFFKSEKERLQIKIQQMQEKIDELVNVIKENENVVFNSEIKIEYCKNQLLKYEEQLSDLDIKEEARIQIISQKDKIISELNELVSSQKYEISNLKDLQIRQNIEIENVEKTISLKKEIRILGIPVYSYKSN